MRPLVVALAAVNLLAFILCGADKSRARRHRRRVPEAALLGMALVGGSPGLLLGLAVFRHKTRKARFWAGVPAILILQLIALWRLMG